MKIKSLTGIDIVGKVRNIPEAAGRKSLCCIGVVLGLFVKHLFMLIPEVIAP